MAISATPFLMFTGNAQAAMDLYTSLFENSQITRVDCYSAGEPDAAGSIKVAAFTLCGREFKCSDSPVKHNFSFTPSSSILSSVRAKRSLIVHSMYCRKMVRY